MDILTIIFTITIFFLLIISIAFVSLFLSIFTGKSIRNKKYPPVIGTVFGQLLYFNRLYDQLTEFAHRDKTFRLLAPDQSEIYTTDPSNIEHILKTNFDKYTKGKYNQDILRELFGQGIFIVDGEKWQQQRKLASFEFSTRVLRDFSCIVFRKIAVKLARKVSDFSTCQQSFDIQGLLMRCTLDSMFKVGFGVDLNCLEGSQKEAVKFIEAFDDANQLTYWRYVDPTWKLKRYLNIGSEASLKKNIKTIHHFVDELIRTKKTQMETKQEYNDKEDILSRFLLESRMDPERMNDRYLRDIILNFMLAGKDSTANTLSWFFYMLCKHPLIQEKIVEEVRQVLCGHKEGTIDELMESLADESLGEMHYLHATLTETLRLYPAVPVDCLMRYTLDSIFKVGFGVELDCLEGSQKEALRFIKAFDDSSQLIYWRIMDPLWKLKRYLNVGSEATFKRNINIIHSFVDELIKTKRKQESNAKEDILSRFLLEGRKDSEKMTSEYIRDAILNFIAAGKDTTAYTLSWFFYMLCKHPLIQERIVQEVTEFTGGHLNDFVESLSDEILEKMHYLQATLTETLRLYPAAPVGRRCAETDDILPSGFKVKKGDGICHMPYAMGRMQYIWGDDARDFRPERWLRNGIFQPESPFKFTAFNAGPRICLGKHFAYMEMKIVAVALLDSFRFKLANETENVTYTTMFTLQVKGGLHVYAIPREGNQGDLM